ncbi:hypothetical protein SFR_0653 [Streptomyces sp. FR-008]|nr:hypothetical protein SFR_0653 [Streptomyces sp. FR-008]
MQKKGKIFWRPPGERREPSDPGAVPQCDGSKHDGARGGQSVRAEFGRRCRSPHHRVRNRAQENGTTFTPSRRRTRWGHARVYTAPLAVKPWCTPSTSAVHAR